MRKLQLKATELVDTDVNFVSLVTRGANRIPFRITKEDELMLDLHKIARSLFKTADPKPEIVAVIAQKGADQDKVLEVIKSAGLEPSDFAATEKDGILTFAKADADMAEGSLVIKVSDSVAMVVSRLQKAFEGFDFESTTFGDVMASGSFCTSMCVATDMLSATIGNILAHADSPVTAADQIEKAVGQYQSYVVTLAKGLPVQAFKADVGFARTPLAVEPVHTAAMPEVVVEVPEPVTETAPGSVETAKIEPDAEREEVAEAVANAEQEDTAEDTAEGVANAMSEQDEVEIPVDLSNSAQVDAETVAADADQSGQKELLAGINEMRKTFAEAVSAASDRTRHTELLVAIAEMQKTFAEAVTAVKEDVREQVQELTTRVDQVATLAKKTDAALNGTVFNEAGGDRPGRITKTGIPSTPPLLDTAYNRPALGK
jgi:hypothetical protein